MSTLLSNLPVSSVPVVKMLGQCSIGHIPTLTKPNAELYAFQICTVATVKVNNNIFFTVGAVKPQVKLLCEVLGESGLCLLRMNICCYKDFSFIL